MFEEIFKTSNPLYVYVIASIGMVLNFLAQAQVWLSFVIGLCTIVFIVMQIIYKIEQIIELKHRNLKNHEQED